MVLTVKWRYGDLMEQDHNDQHQWSGFLTVGELDAELSGDDGNYTPGRPVYLLVKLNNDTMNSLKDRGIFRAIKDLESKRNSDGSAALCELRRLLAWIKLDTAFDEDVERVGKEIHG